MFALPPRSFKWKHKAHGFGNTAFKHSSNACSFLGVFQLGIARGDVDRQSAFLQQIVCDIFVDWNNILVRDFQQRCQLLRKPTGGFCSKTIIVIHVCNQLRVVPDGHSVLSPVTAQRPARKRFAGIPLSLAIMQEGSCCETTSQLLDQYFRQPAFVGANRCRIPFFAFHVVNRHKGRLSAHGQTHVAVRQSFVDFLAQLVDGRPLRFSVGLGHSRIFMNASHGHAEFKFNFAFIQCTGNWCR